MFTLGDDNPESTETGAIFAGTGSEVKPEPKRKLSAPPPTPGKPNRFDQLREAKEKEKGVVIEDANDEEDADELGISEDRLKEMKELAKKLSTQMFKNKNNRAIGATCEEVSNDKQGEPQATTSQNDSAVNADPSTCKVNDCNGSKSKSRAKDKKKHKKKKKKDASEFTKSCYYSLKKSPLNIKNNTSL